jgi:hypothetical protein
MLRQQLAEFGPQRLRLCAQPVLNRRSPLRPQGSARQRQSARRPRDRSGDRAFPAGRSSPEGSPCKLLAGHDDRRKELERITQLLECHAQAVTRRDVGHREHPAERSVDAPETRCSGSAARRLDKCPGIGFRQSPESAAVNSIEQPRVVCRTESTAGSPWRLLAQRRWLYSASRSGRHHPAQPRASTGMISAMKDVPVACIAEFRRPGLARVDRNAQQRTRAAAVPRDAWTERKRRMATLA